MVPEDVGATVPLTGSRPISIDPISNGVSTSVSFARTGRSSETLNGTVNVSLLATGASLIPATVIETVATLLSNPAASRAR